MSNDISLNPPYEIPVAGLTSQQRGACEPPIHWKMGAKRWREERISMGTQDLRNFVGSDRSFGLTKFRGNRYLQPSVMLQACLSKVRFPPR
jgi:hypothetical protein